MSQKYLVAKPNFETFSFMVIYPFYLTKSLSLYFIYN